jgi:hypothetical protein
VPGDRFDLANGIDIGVKPFLAILMCNFISAIAAVVAIPTPAVNRLVCINRLDNLARLSWALHREGA